MEIWKNWSWLCSCHLRITMHGVYGMQWRYDISFSLTTLFFFPMWNTINDGSSEFTGPIQSVVIQAENIELFKFGGPRNLYCNCQISFLFQLLFFSLSREPALRNEYWLRSCAQEQIRKSVRLSNVTSQSLAGTWSRILGPIHQDTLNVYLCPCVRWAKHEHSCVGGRTSLLSFPTASEKS